MTRNRHPKPKLESEKGDHFFQLLFKSHPVPMYVYDMETLAILDVNDAAVEKYFYPRDEFLTLSMKDLAEEGDASLLSNNGRGKTRETHFGKLKHKRRDDRFIDVEITAHVVDFNGREAALVVTRDAVEPGRAREGGTELDIELRALFASMQDVVMVLDRDGVCRKIAPTNTNLSTGPKDELLGKNLWDFFPVEQADQFINMIRDVLKTGQSAHIEHELSINGQAAWFATSISPMDENHTLWVARDVTDRKLADRKLLESEERYHSLFERMMDGVYRSTHEGKFVDVNPAMVKMFGYSSREEMLAMDIKSELYFDAAERGTHKLDTGSGETDIYRLRRKDGSEIWVEDRGTYTYDQQGNIIYHEGTLRDVTARLRAEEDLRSAKASLELANQELEHVLAREQHLARTDGLTGLYNYRYFFELASREFQIAMRYRRPLSVLMFDTDDFKAINDTLGHFAGDKILAQIARTTAAQMRSVDVLARYGGDEFIILLPQTSAKKAFPIAERIRANVAAITIPFGEGLTSVTLSIGIAEISHQPVDESAENIVQRADKALYAAKQAGRNQTMIHTAAEDGEA